MHLILLIHMELHVICYWKVEKVYELYTHLNVDNYGQPLLFQQNICQPKKSTKLPACASPNCSLLATHISQLIAADISHGSLLA